ncbi:hypothetical protein TFLX_00852 [Thermoflexales bacterium]|nr:hypothetical protein TFLX_00852 [Thermoflexales bacterium]
MKSIFDFRYLLIVLICLVAFALRLGPLFDNRFHPDEALFSTWALQLARGENFLLAGVPVDKPPLLIYLTALSFFIFGQSELAARVPNLLASVVSVPLVYQLTRRAYFTGRSASHAERTLSEPEQSEGESKRQSKHAHADDPAFVVALLLALSPFAILFAPTAFLDPLMVMFGLAALVAVSRGRAGWAGIWLGLSFATKVQGLFFAPLLLVFWIACQPKQSSRHPFILSPGHSLWRLLLAGLSIMLAVLLWDRLRGGSPFWVQQTINYGGIRVIYASELGPRLIGWLNFLPYFFGPIIGALGLIGLPILLYRDLTRDARTRSAWIDLWLFTYTIGFLALHWFLAFPVWDRYLLLLVPITALLFSRAVYHLVTWSPHHRVSPPLVLFVIALTLLPFSLVAARSGYPIGGDHGANDGIEPVADFLKSLPPGTVVYDHWLAWQLGYYLGDGFAYVAYFDTPAALADDLRVFARGDDRYVIFPAREAPDKVIDAIGQVGYTLTPVFTTQNRFGQTSFTVYQIIKRKT